MTMLRTYLIKATYSWLLDHNLNPYILVNTEQQGVKVPTKYIDNDGKILLDLSHKAVVNFYCNNKKIEFDATFDSIVVSIIIPIEAILALYSNETHQGLYIDEMGCVININEGENINDFDPDKNSSYNNPSTLHVV